MYGTPSSSAPTSHDAAHVLALEPRTRARFAHEALHDLGLIRELRIEHLDRDLLIESDVGRDVDRAHAALSEQTLDAQLASHHGPRLEHLRRS